MCNKLVTFQSKRKLNNVSSNLHNANKNDGKEKEWAKEREKIEKESIAIVDMFYWQVYKFLQCSYTTLLYFKQNNLIDYKKLGNNFDMGSRQGRGL